MNPYLLLLLGLLVDVDSFHITHVARLVVRTNRAQGYDNDEFLSGLSSDSSSGGSKFAAMQQRAAAASASTTSPESPSPPPKSDTIFDRENYISASMNTGDMYLEQLKVDTKVRLKAYREGDYDKFNERFVSEEVREMQKIERNRPKFEDVSPDVTTGDVDGADVEYDEVDEANLTEVQRWHRFREREAMEEAKEAATESRKPVSNYKEMLSKAMKGREVGGQPEGGAPVPEPVPVPISVKVLQPLAPTPEPTPAPSSGLTDFQRDHIRTTQGLLLKHRGGRGFGTGRLKGAEGDKLVQNLLATKEMLAGFGQPEQEQEREVAVAVVPPPTTLPPPSPSPPIPTSSSSISNSNPLLSTSLKCASAAIEAFQNNEAPIESLKHALLFAASCCETSPSPPPLSTSTTTTTTLPEPIFREAASLFDVNLDDDQGSRGSSSAALFESALRGIDDLSGDGKFGLRPLTPEDDTFLKTLKGVKDQILSEADESF